MPKARIFNLLQYEYNPVTGASLHFNEQNIINGVNHKSIERWAYIRHDKDEYTELDVERMQKFNMNVVIGQTKPPHWHIVLKCPSVVDTSAIAKWFGIPENMIEIPKGRGSFLDCVGYLTHSDIKQQLASKHTYDAGEVKANFDWKSEVDAAIVRKTRYGKELSEKEWYRNEIYSGNMTIRQLVDKDQNAYVNDSATLDRLRMKYLHDKAPIPSTRINYYVDGESGIGKGLLSRALARSLYPYLKDDRDIFFQVGAKGAAFEGYDGQPVIIWNDRRAADLIEELNGRGNVFNVFDTHPTRISQNVKYASVILCNEVNIINGIVDYSTFLDGLAGNEDKNQSYRRMPLILRLREEDFDILINKGFANNTNDYREYISYGRVRASMKRIAERCGDNVEIVRQLEGEAVKPIVEKHNEIVSVMNKQTDDTASILEEFKNTGHMMTGDEITYDDYCKFTSEELKPYGIKWTPLPFEKYMDYHGKIPDLENLDESDEWITEREMIVDALDKELSKDELLKDKLLKTYGLSVKDALLKIYGLS